MARDSANPRDSPVPLRSRAGSFSRRRKPGVTELGSMATVQETAGVDSRMLFLPYFVVKLL